MTRPSIEMPGRFMRAVEVANPGHRTRTWRIENAEDGWCLGGVRFYGGWRRCVFDPSENVQFSAGCLRDIARFLDAATREQFDHARQERTAP